MKMQRKIDRQEQELSWQGANPKKLPFAELRDHIQKHPGLDPVEAKYQARIKNRATGIRAYCVQCQGGSVVDVKECTSVTCPLFPFRMGSDPLRGYELPKADVIVYDEPEAEDDVELFEDGDDETDVDATE